MNNLQFTGKLHDYLSIHQTNIVFDNIYVVILVYDVTLYMFILRLRNGTFTMNVNIVCQIKIRCDAADGQVELFYRTTNRMYRMANQEKWKKFWHVNFRMLQQINRQIIDIFFFLQFFGVRISCACLEILLPFYFDRIYQQATTWPNSISTAYLHRLWNGISNGIHPSRSHKTHSSFKLHGALHNMPMCMQTSKQQQQQQHKLISHCHTFNKI